MSEQPDSKTKTSTAGEPILPQLELGARIGGMKELATRLSFYNGVVNSLMVAALYYGQNPMIPGLGVRLQAIIPTILVFYGILVAGAVLLAIFEHVFVIRAQMEYNQMNEFNEGVSPIRRHLSEFEQNTGERLDRIESKLEEAINNDW